MKVFSYFSAKSPTLYGRLGGSHKNDLVSRLIGISEVHQARDYARDERDKYEREFISIDSSLSTLATTMSRAAESQRQYTDKQISTSEDKDEIAKVKSVLKEITDEIEKLKPAIAHNDSSITAARSAISTLTNIKTSQENMLRTGNAEIQRLKRNIIVEQENLSKALTGKCPTCNSTLKDETIQKQIMDRISSLQDSRKKLKENLPQQPEIDKYDLKMTKISQSLERMRLVTVDYNSKIDKQNRLTTQLSISHCSYT